MSKKQFISHLKDGEIVDDVFAVKFKKPPVPYQKGYWFEIRISDKTDEITAKYWSTDDLTSINKVYASFEKGDVVHIIGKASTYMNKMEISINPPSGKIIKTENYSISDFISESKFNIEEMYSTLLNYINSIKNKDMVNILNSFFIQDAEFIKQFKFSPAAMHLHQNYLGGLLEHTLNVTSICKTISEIYPELDYDLLVTASLLHDIGKIKEFDVTTSIDVSEEGMLKGHITIGNELLVEKMKALNTPNLIALKLSHMMLSQHGKKEFGSPVNPQMPEAVALYFADDCDSKVYQYLKAKLDAKTDDLWIYNSKLGHVYLK